MKKINLFLWGIVSTCITFFYRTEICEGGVRYSVSKFVVSTCDGYDEDVFKAQDKLNASVTTHMLCPKGKIFIGCSLSSTSLYELSEYGLDGVAIHCLVTSLSKGMCRDAEVCPTPGTKQDSDQDTFIYKDARITVCSAHYIEINEDGLFTYTVDHDDNDDPILYKQYIDLYQPRDSSAFGHVNSISNTCAINTDVRLDDDTGYYSYTDKCYYSE